MYTSRLNAFPYPPLQETVNAQSHKLVGSIFIEQYTWCRYETQPSPLAERLSACACQPWANSRGSRCGTGMTWFFLISVTELARMSFSVCLACWGYRTRRAGALLFYAFVHWKRVSGYEAVVLYLPTLWQCDHRIINPTPCSLKTNKIQIVVCKDNYSREREWDRNQA